MLGGVRIVPLSTRTACEAGHRQTLGEPNELFERGSHYIIEEDVKSKYETGVC